MQATRDPVSFYDYARTIASEEQLRATLAENGRMVRGHSNDPRYLQDLAEAAQLMDDVFAGRRPAWRLEEALSTSDFPILMGDILDRQLLGRYAEFPVTWPNYAKKGLVRDFRTVRRIYLDGDEGPYYPSYLKQELAAVQEDEAMTEGQYTYAVKVYEKGIGLNWRMIVNDDLDAFQTLPDRLARGARRTEERFTTELFVDASGPHASFYTSGNKNQIITANGATSNNPVLSIGGLQSAFTVLSKMRDAGGDPIVIEAVELVVPPALQIQAQNILNATELWITAAGSGGASDQELHVVNWMRSKTRLNVNPYIPIVASSANGDSSWFLFAATGVGRPALEVGFLRGYDQPSLWEKAPNMQRIGGGLDANMGDFDTGERRIKGMHIIGGTRMDPKMTVASNGSGA